MRPKVIHEKNEVTNIKKCVQVEDMSSAENDLNPPEKGKFHHTQEHFCLLHVLLINLEFSSSFFQCAFVSSPYKPSFDIDLYLKIVNGLPRNSK